MDKSSDDDAVKCTVAVHEGVPPNTLLAELDQRSSNTKDGATINIHPPVSEGKPELPKTPSSGSFKFTDQIQYMYEHQRWYLIGGWHDLTGMWRHKEDPPTYSIHDVTTSTGIWDESYEEEMDYEIDSCWEVVEDDFTEKGGWVSASDWTRLDGGLDAWGKDTGHHTKEGKPTARSSDRVRRRLWKRKSEMEQHIESIEHKANPTVVAAYDGATAKEMFFTALSKLMKKQGLFALLDGSAWIRLGRRDVADYQSWVRAKALSVMRVGGGGGWMLTYPSLTRPLGPGEAPRSIRTVAPSSPGSLRELACGCLHACAAYGYPMAQGWLTSVQSGASLFTWRRLKIVNNDVVRGVDDKTHNDAVKQVVGSLFEIVTANWSSATFMPVWYLGVDHATKWIVLSVRGTLNSTDILTDLTVSATPLGGGHVHRGVLEASLRLFAVIVEPLSQVHKKWPNYRVVCCGHSLGGGIAAITCSMLRGIEDFATATSISIGPAACVSRDVDVSLHVKGGSFPDFATSVSLGMDPITRLSLVNVDRLVKDLKETTITATAANAATSAANTIAAAPQSLMDAFRNLGRNSEDGGIELDDMVNMTDEEAMEMTKKTQQVAAAAIAAEDAFARGEQSTETVIEEQALDKTTIPTRPAEEGREEEHEEAILACPGILLHIDDEIELASSPQVVAFPINPAEYDRVPLSYSFMAYHLPQRYLAALLALAELPSLKIAVDDLHAIRKSPHGQAGLSEESQDVDTHVINETQFMIRFEHVTSAFDIVAKAPPVHSMEVKGQGRVDVIHDT